MFLNRLCSVPSRTCLHHLQSLKCKRYFGSQNINAQKLSNPSICMAEAGAQNLETGSFEPQEPEQIGVPWNPHLPMPMIDGSSEVRQLIEVHYAISFLQRVVLQMAV